MSDKAYKVLAEAGTHAGAASYLFEKELRFLERHGLIYRDGKYKFRTTEEGRRVWLSPSTFRPRRRR